MWAYYQPIKVMFYRTGTFVLSKFNLTLSGRTSEDGCPQNFLIVTGNTVRTVLMLKLMNAFIVLASSNDRSLLSDQSLRISG